MEKEKETPQNRVSVIVKAKKKENSQEDLSLNKEEMKRKESLEEDKMINSYIHKKFNAKIARMIIEEKKKGSGGSTSELRY